MIFHGFGDEHEGRPMELCSKTLDQLVNLYRTAFARISPCFGDYSFGFCGDIFLISTFATLSRRTSEHVMRTNMFDFTARFHIFHRAFARSYFRRDTTGELPDLFKACLKAAPIALARSFPCFPLPMSPGSGSFLSKNKRPSSQIRFINIPQCLANNLPIYGQSYMPKRSKKQQTRGSRWVQSNLPTFQWKFGH